MGADSCFERKRQFMTSVAISMYTIGSFEEIDNTNSNTKRGVVLDSLFEDPASYNLESQDPQSIQLGNHSVTIVCNK